MVLPMVNFHGFLINGRRKRRGLKSQCGQRKGVGTKHIQLRCALF